MILIDWLGNDVEVGDTVFWTSQSGVMNLGVVERIDTVERSDYHRGTYSEARITVRPIASSLQPEVRPQEWAVTLLERNHSFKTVTLYSKEYWRRRVKTDE